MKIRNRITLWITSAGLLAAFLFSIVMFGLAEQPFQLVDRELENHTNALFFGIVPQNGAPITQADTMMLDLLGKLYWLKVFDQQHNTIYASSMTKFVDVPLKKNDKRYNINIRVPLDANNLDQDKNKNVTFRVRISTIPFGGQEYLVQIAKPMEKLIDEIVELVVAIGVGLVFFTIALILLGYFVAGKVLQPISAINSMTREISDKTLDKRIPLGKNQDELHALSSSLNQMFDRLQYSFKRQKEFIANASHELKTPIAIQRLFFDEAVHRKDLSENFKSKLVIQSGVALRMTKLVKNMLDLSALERSETLDLDTIDLVALATSVFEEFNEILQAAGIRLSLDMEDAVLLQADKEQIQRLLINLIDNGIKYNLPEDGEIHFSLSKTENEVGIQISNTGQVIPEDELGQVFNQFYRVEKSRSVALGGSGLGLTIVKRIVALHHGTIDIENTPTSCIQVKIVLPR